MPGINVEKGIRYREKTMRNAQNQAVVPDKRRGGRTKDTRPVPPPPEARHSVPRFGLDLLHTTLQLFLHPGLAHKSAGRVTAASKCRNHDLSNSFRSQ